MNRCVHCPRKHLARGLCSTHYAAARRAWMLDGVDIFPAREEAKTALAAQPLTCLYRACVADVYLHGVCSDHLLATLAAGRRAKLHRPRARLTAVTAERAA